MLHVLWNKLHAVKDTYDAAYTASHKNEWQQYHFPLPDAVGSYSKAS